MFGQPSYVSIFQADEERPRHNIAWPWWQHDATTILWGYNLERIKRVIRYGLCADENHCRLALEKRPPAVIHNFLDGLAAPEKWLEYGRLSHEEKVGKIMRRCRLPVPPVLTWSWLPTRSNDGLAWDPLAMAKAIDAESHIQFNRIGFEDLVQYSLGHASRRVDWFLDQHSCFYAHLLDHFNAFPGELATYLEVEKVS